MQLQTASAILSVISAMANRRLKRKQMQPMLRLAFLSKSKACKVPLRLVLRLPSRVLIQRNWGRSLGCLPLVTLTADFLIAVNHSRRKGFRVIRDRLTHGRKALYEWSHRERRRGRDLRWTLRGMPAQVWGAENWPGRATILAVRCKGVREGKPIDVTHSTSRAT